MESSAGEGVGRNKGDFSVLAEEHFKFRPGYSESVASMILSLVDKPVSDIDFADIGAGEMNFQQWRSAKIVEIDGCARRIRVLQ